MISLGSMSPIVQPRGKDDYFSGLTDVVDLSALTMDSGLVV